MTMMLWTFLTVSAVIFVLLSLFARKLTLLKRVIISITVFLILSLSFVLVLILVGDRPSKNAEKVLLENIDEKTGTYKAK